MEWRLRCRPQLRLRVRSLSLLWIAPSCRYRTRMTPQFTLRPSKKVTHHPNRIREYRLKAGLTQLDLGRTIGSTRGTVSSWERGCSVPTVAKLFKLARALSTLSEALYPALYSPESPQHGSSDPSAA